MEKGLYKKIDEYALAYAKNEIHKPFGKGVIDVQEYEYTNYDVWDGWYWFATESEARQFFSIKEMPIEVNPFDAEINN